MTGPTAKRAALAPLRLRLRPSVAASCSAQRFDCAASRASTMTRTTGSVPDGRISTRPLAPSSRSTSARRSASARFAVQSSPGLRRTLISVCGKRSTPASRSAERPARADDRLEHHQRADDAVAGRVAVEREQVARALAAELPAALQQLLEHVAVADRGANDVDAAAAQRLLDAEVGHQRADDAGHGPAVVEAGGGEHVEQLVAVVEAAGAVDDLQPVAVAVEGDAVVGAAGDDGIDERLRRGRAEAGVDVEAVGTAADRR